MAFDISTAKPVAAAFDVGTAEPVSPGAVARQPGGVLDPQPTEEPKAVSEVLGTNSIDLEGAGQALLQGATLGFADEIQSVIAATVAAPFVTDKTFGQLMQDARKSFREENEQFKSDNPKLSTALEVAGGLTTGGFALKKGAGPVVEQSLGKTIAKGAATGTGLGAVQGAGMADEDEFLSPETAKKSATSAAIGGVASGVLTGIIGKFAKGSAFKKEIARRLEAGETDNDLAKYMINGAGKVKTDKIAQETIKQGFDDGVIAAVKGGSPTDRVKMLKMVNIMEKGRKNKAFSVTNRASDVAGDSVLSRYRTVKAVNSQAGKDIDRIAKTLKGQKVDITDALDGFSQKLDDFGVEITQGADGVKANFTNSVLSPGDRGPIKEVVRQMARIAKSGDPDALQAHQLKRIIDNNVTFGKTKTGLGGDASRALKDFRRSIDASLDDTFPAYNTANTQYADTVDVMNQLQDVAGRKMDLTGPGGDKAVGTLLRRLMGNTQSRVNLLDAVNNLDDIAKKYGGQFDDNVSVQMLFADELDRVFKPTARTSFAGQIGQEVERAAQQPANQTIIGTTAKALGKGVEKARGINEENAIKSIKELLK